MMHLLAMTFAEPNWLYWLFLCPVVAGLKLWADARARRAVNLLTAPRLRDSLVPGGHRLRSWLIFGLQLAALALLVVALAQPRWGEDKITQQESGRNIIIALDTSRSMLANDVVPDRLSRARLAAQDVLAQLKGDRVGLIAFAGNAYLQAPLTTDHDAVIEAIQSLDFYSVPRGGSELGKALQLAMETFEKSPARNHGLILFSDGGDPESGLADFAKAALKRNVLVLTVGVGTEAGSLIPDPDPDRAGDYIRDEEGKVVRTKLEPKGLQEIAAQTKGRYLKLGSQPLASGVVRDLLAALEAQANAARELVRPVERYQWPLCLSVLFLMTAWLIRPSPRRRTATPRAVAASAILFVILAPPAPAQAGPLAFLFGNKESAPTPEEAYEAYRTKDYKKAAGLFDSLMKVEAGDERKRKFALGLGTASHQLKDYDKAVSAFGTALRSPLPADQLQAHQGMGHTLYDQGDAALGRQPQFTLKAWKDSVKHFNAALKLDPENKSLTENRDFVQARLDQLQQAMEQQQQQKKKGQKGQKGDKQKGQKGEEGEEGEDGEGEDGEGDQDKDGEGGEKSRKESLGKDKGEKKEEELPDGKVEAGQEGEQQGEKGEMKENGNETDDATGFSKNEARAFLRAYADDQKKAQLVRPRDPPVNGKDW